MLFSTLHLRHLKPSSELAVGRGKWWVLIFLILNTVILDVTGVDDWCDTISQVKNYIINTSVSHLNLMCAIKSHFGPPNVNASADWSLFASSIFSTMNSQVSQFYMWWGHEKTYRSPMKKYLKISGLIRCRKFVIVTTGILLRCCFEHSTIILWLHVQQDCDSIIDSASLRCDVKESLVEMWFRWGFFRDATIYIWHVLQ